MCRHSDRAAVARARYTDAPKDALQDKDLMASRSALAVLNTLAWIFPPEHETQLAVCAMPHAEAADAACSS